MPDAVQIAMKYRSRLKAEIDKIDGFLAMADELSKSGETEIGVRLAKSSETKAPEAAVASEIAKPADGPKIDLARRTGNGVSPN